MADRSPLPDYMEGTFSKYTATPTNPYVAPTAPTSGVSTYPSQTMYVQPVATNNDAYYMQSPELIRQRVMAIIANRNVTVTTGEVNDLVNRVLTGQSTFDGIRQAVETETFRRMVPSPTDGTGTGGTGTGGTGEMSEAERMQALLEQQQRLQQELLNQTNQANQRAARAMVEELLAQLGLPASLVNVVDALIKGNAPTIEINQRIRETQEWKTRFRGIELLRQNGFNVISEGEYIAYENTVRQAAHRFGISREFIDELLPEMIGNNVGAPEALERMEAGFAASMSAPQAVRDELSRLYGVDQGRLAEYWMDPDRSTRIIMREFQAAQMGSKALQTGFGSLGRGQAERLADLGITESEAEQGMSSLAGSRQVTGRLVGEFDDGPMSVDEQLDAVFASDAKAQAKLRSRRERRTAAFQGEGGAAANQTGVLGLGKANL